MRIVAIGGEPGTGKSTLMKMLINQYSVRYPFVFGLARGSIAASPHLKEGVAILGLYPEGEVFGGTDRLSMAVQPHATSLLDQLEKDGHNLLFEGDRLFNQSFIESCKARGDTKVIILTTTPETLKSRYLERGTAQNEKFLKGRATKYRNLISALPDITIRPNTTPEQQAETASEIMAFLHP